MPIRSMTGFARVARSIPLGELTLSIKTVNHRGLDLHFHMPLELDAAEPAMRSAIRGRVSRGHVQVQVQFRRVNGASSCFINEPMLTAWMESFRAVSGRLGLSTEPDLNQALRLPGMLETNAVQKPDESLEAEALSATQEALAELDHFRVREGRAIEDEIRGRAASIRTTVQRMESIRATALPFFHQRLHDRLRELLGLSQIDPARVSQEAAMLAERSDISEELVRLKTHANHLEDLLSADGETGKKLDFLLQEMNRETNTILSKTSGLGEPGLTLTDLGLVAKAEIDRIREQSLNIE